MDTLSSRSAHHTPSKQSFPIRRLPLELQGLVADHLPGLDIKALRLVCKTTLQNVDRRFEQLLQHANVYFDIRSMVVLHELLCSQYAIHVRSISISHKSLSDGLIVPLPNSDREIGQISPYNIGLPKTIHRLVLANVFKEILARLTNLERFSIGVVGSKPFLWVLGRDRIYADLNSPTTTVAEWTFGYHRFAHLSVLRDDFDDVLASALPLIALHTRKLRTLNVDSESFLSIGIGQCFVEQQTLQTPRPGFAQMWSRFESLEIETNDYGRLIGIPGTHQEAGASMLLPVFALTTNLRKLRLGLQHHGSTQEIELLLFNMQLPMLCEASLACFGGSFSALTRFVDHHASSLRSLDLVCARLTDSSTAWLHLIRTIKFLTPDLWSNLFMPLSHEGRIRLFKEGVDKKNDDERIVTDSTDEDFYHEMSDFMGTMIDSEPLRLKNMVSGIIYEWMGSYLDGRQAMLNRIAE